MRQDILFLQNAKKCKMKIILVKISICCIFQQHNIEKHLHNGFDSDKNNWTDYYELFSW